MLNILAVLVAFILMCQAFIILFYLCGRKRLNRYLYRKWLIEKYERNHEDDNKEENDESNGYYV